MAKNKKHDIGKILLLLFSDLKKKKIDNKKNNKLKLSPFNQIAVPIKYGE
jgi:hypothetical protein